MLLELVDLCCAEETPGIHGRGEMEAVSGINWGGGRVVHGMIIAVFVVSDGRASFCISHCRDFEFKRRVMARPSLNDVGHGDRQKEFGAPRGTPPYPDGNSAASHLPRSRTIVLQLGLTSEDNCATQDGGNSKLFNI